MTQMRKGIKTSDENINKITMLEQGVRMNSLVKIH